MSNGKPLLGIKLKFNLELVQIKTNTHAAKSQGNRLKLDAVIVKVFIVLYNSNLGLNVLNYTYLAYVKGKVKIERFG